MRKINASREYRENFRRFFALLDREAMKWGETCGEDYVMSYRTAEALFNRAWALNGCGDEPWVSIFVYATLSKVQQDNSDPEHPWRMDYSPLVNFLEERYSELTTDPAELTDEERAEWAQYWDGEKYDFRDAWVDDVCKYEAWEQRNPGHSFRR